jgi:hypothetical protein
VSAKRASADLLGLVVAAAQIGGIRLVEAAASSRIRSADEVPDGATVHISHGATVVEGGEGRDFRVRAVVDAFVRSEDDGDAFLRVRGVFELDYRLAEGTRASKKALNLFAEANGVFNAWPYFREFVQSTTQRMGVPPIVLPLYRLRSGDKAPEKGTDHPPGAGAHQRPALTQG